MIICANNPAESITADIGPEHIFKTAKTKVPETSFKKIFCPHNAYLLIINCKSIFCSFLLDRYHRNTITSKRCKFFRITRYNPLHPPFDELCNMMLNLRRVKMVVWVELIHIEDPVAAYAGIFCNTAHYITFVPANSFDN
ncbi:MAG: hypothetical protein BWY69_00007 [Planctomycetes bacterium ADurb.Bin401]|nr:MAG: hypothetical protein BWY69_00007 [Planctomycetes bacterium ADurb.Bin401]